MAVPQSILIRSGDKIATAGLLGVAVAAAAPVAVVAAIGAVGFGSGSVAAASMAAGTMSAEAVASGGAIAAVGASAVAAAAEASQTLAAIHIQGLDLQGVWVVVVEEWLWRGCIIYRFPNSQEACAFFDSKWSCARILVNPLGYELAHGIFGRLGNLHGPVNRVRRHWQNAAAAG